MSSVISNRNRYLRLDDPICNIVRYSKNISRDIKCIIAFKTIGALHIIIRFYLLLNNYFGKMTEVTFLICLSILNVCLVFL